MHKNKSEKAFSTIGAKGYLLVMLAFGGIAGGYFLWEYTDNNSDDLATHRSAPKPVSAVTQLSSDSPTLREPKKKKEEVPMPEPPPNLLEVRAKAYKEALALNKKTPALTAFRKSVSHFIEYNRQFADAQAQAEGISVEEVEELTFFGFLTQATQRWEDVEEVLGKKLSEASRNKASKELDQLNREFTKAMRKMVNEGATEPERWEYIREVQSRYLNEYYAITDMNESLLQDLLAGDITRTYPVTEEIPPELTAEQNSEYPN